MFRKTKLCDDESPPIPCFFFGFRLLRLGSLWTKALEDLLVKKFGKQCELAHLHQMTFLRATNLFVFKKNRKQCLHAFEFACFFSTDSFANICRARLKPHRLTFLVCFFLRAIIKRRARIKLMNNRIKATLAEGNFLCSELHALTAQYCGTTFS